MQKKPCRILVYGFDGETVHPIKTDIHGNLLVAPAAAAPSVFHEEVFIGTSALPEWTFLPIQDTAAQTTYSYAILNRSSVPVLARVDVSPDGMHFAFDREAEVEPGSLSIIVPAVFLKYTRIGVKTDSPQNGPAILDIYFQAQAAT